MIPSDLEVAISTVDRKPQFIHATLESFYGKGGQAVHKLPVRLVVCGASGEYIGQPWLRGFHGDRRLKLDIEVAAGRELSLLEKTPPEGRCLLNFRRVLGSGNGPLLALQDDVAFTSDWYDKLGRLLHDFERKRIELERRTSYIMALYCSYRFRDQGGWAYYPWYEFYGNQALYLSAGGRQRLRRYIDDELRDGRPKSDDMMVKDAAQPAKIDIYAAIPNLVQHIGNSSALGLHFHQSPTFQP